ncbi:MAG: hypothetical protein KC543_01970 [Myxococcales bacterium]|nr:hypothetical protein [Myxococcales bacterium]
MTEMLYMPLPVTDVRASTAFYAAVGAIKDEARSNETTTSMIVSEMVTLMLLPPERWDEFSSGTPVDDENAGPMAFCTTADSREACDSAVEAAVKAGGTADPMPKEDYGARYSRSYADLDGHIWQILA